MDATWQQQVQRIIDGALEEDLASGDITTDPLIPPGLRGRASIVVKGEGVVAGLGVASRVFLTVDPQLSVEETFPEGARARRGDVVAVVEGSVAGILRAERTALNFLSHMSGIATETARYVEVVSGTGAKILDTRKTLPGLRPLEKYAVRAGGGVNHRLGLGDGILVKDNHLEALSAAGIGLREAVEKARSSAPPGTRVEIEVESVSAAAEALEAGADVLLLDNMGLDDMRSVVGMARGRALTEASGGITLDNLRAVAETGVDFISAGALTHSARALDISLDLEVLR